MAETFGRGRCWLAGDAAHLTGPIGMQSMNAGFFEAWQLANSLCRLLRSGGDLSALAECGAHSQHLWSRLNGVGSGLHPTAGADPWVASHAGQLLSCLPAYGEPLSGLAAQIGLKY